MKVLVIEDEELIRESIVDILSMRGFHARGAEDGYIGLELAKEINPDLILCDVRMPGLDGYAVLRALRTDSTTARVRFIFLTAETTQAVVTQEQQQKADGYLAKPFTSNQLLEAIAKCGSERTET